MSLADSLPWAIAAGRNAGIANRNARAVDEWRKYAHQLEKQVAFYRAEAVNGWAAFRAVKNLSIQNADYDPHNDPEFRSIKRAEIPKLEKELWNDAPK